MPQQWRHRLIYNEQYCSVLHCDLCQCIKLMTGVLALTLIILTVCVSVCSRGPSLLNRTPAFCTVPWQQHLLWIQSSSNNGNKRLNDWCCYKSPLGHKIASDHKGKDRLTWVTALWSYILSLHSLTEFNRLIIKSSTWLKWKSSILTSLTAN